MQTELLKGIKVEKKPGSTVAISGELPFSELEKHRAKAVEAISKEVSIDGFRKGHIPENILIQRVGEMTILTEMAERALGVWYPKVVEAEKLDVIGYPKISITKLAKDNPLGFTITVAVVPEVKLPNYEKIAKGINKEKESKEVTEDEVTKQVEDILRQKVAYERLQEKANKVNGKAREGALGQQKADAGAETHEHSHEGHEHHDHSGHDHTHEEKPIEKAEDLKLPELTDEYVKSLGKPGQFENVADFRGKIREHLTIEKAREVDSRHRAKLTDAIIEKTEMELPQVLVDAEMNQMFGQMEEDLKRAQLKMDDYLQHVKKTKEDLIREWTPSATKRAKLQLVLNEIAKKDNISADPSAVDHEVSHLLERYKDADEKRVRTYVTSVLVNEAVMKKLEEVK